MRNSRFTEEQISGRAVGQRCVPGARHQRCDLLKWRSRFGRMELSDARKLKALEEEDRKLKKSWRRRCSTRRR